MQVRQIGRFKGPDAKEEKVDNSINMVSQRFRPGIYDAFMNIELLWHLNISIFMKRLEICDGMEQTVDKRNSLKILNLIMCWCLSPTITITIHHLCIYSNA